MAGVPGGRLALLAAALALAACEQQHRTYRIGDRVQAPPPAVASRAARVIGWNDLLPSQARGSALVSTALDGADVLIAGFVVPLGFRKGATTEFLLVPSYGACIHVPPPPANQIIHVVPARPLELRSMSVVWVSGKLLASTGDAFKSRSGYRMAGAEVVPHVK